MSEEDAKILLAIGQLTTEDKDYFIGLINKLHQRTNLPKKQIMESLKRLRTNKIILDQLKIQTIAEETESWG